MSSKIKIALVSIFLKVVYNENLAVLCFETTWRRMSDCFCWDCAMSATQHLSEMQRCLRGTPHNCCTLIVGVSAGSNEQNAEKLSALPVQTFAPKLCNYSETNQKSSVWVIVVIKGVCFLQYNICDWFPPHRRCKWPPLRKRDICSPLLLSLFRPFVI